MNFNGHLVGSVVAGVATPIFLEKIGFNIDIKENVYIVPSVILGGLALDIDTESKASQYYAIIALSTLVYFFYNKMYYHGIALIIPFLLAKIGKHRGWTHSIFVPILFFVSPIVSILIYTLSGCRFFKYITDNYYVLLVSFAVGNIMHKILDMKIFKKFGK